MSRDLAVVLLSGGMDSLATLAMAKKQHKDIALLHVSYGQNTQYKELDSFEKIADFYQVPKSQRLVVDLNFLRKIGGSSLTDQKINVSKFEGDSDEIPSSYVPFRNTHIIASAVSWAEVLGANKIYIGANEEDSPGYPDCRPAYYDAYNNLIEKGTKEGSIKIITPIIHMKKEEIIQVALDHKEPLKLTWSCYESSDLACGECDSCALRLRGFEKIGQKDPISYR